LFPNLGTSNVKHLVREDFLRVSANCNISSINANIDAAEKFELKSRNLSEEDIRLIKNAFSKL